MKRPGHPPAVRQVGGATPTKRFYDAETGLLAVVEVVGPQGVIRNFSTDYREVDGLKFAHLQDVDMGMMTQSVKVSSIRVNEDITPDKLKELSERK